ncbi:MAG: hypothetical protein ALAOOOJD_04607 [bacterium]|nr:hypothetical protein [bacterium]
MIHNGRQAVILFQQFLDQAADNIQRHLFIEGLQFFLRGALQPANLFHRRFQFIFQRFVPTLKFLAGRSGQRLKIRIAHGLAFLQRNGGHSQRRGLQHKTGFRRLRIDLFQFFGPLLLKRFNDGIAPVIVFITLKRFGNFPPHMFEQALHILLQRPAATGRQLANLRLIGILKIIEVTPIRWRGFAAGQLFQKGAHCRHLADARRPRHENIEAAVVNFQAKLQRRNGAFLPDNSFQRFEVGRGLDAENFRIKRATQLRGEKCLSHGEILFRINDERKSN